MIRTRISHVIPFSNARLYASLALLPLASTAGGIRPREEKNNAFYYTIKRGCQCDKAKRSQTSPEGSQRFLRTTRSPLEISEDGPKNSEDFRR